MRPFLIALQFLTVLPVPVAGAVGADDIRRSLRFFPAAGLAIGMVLAGVVLLSGFLPPLIAGALILGASIAVTGAIHLDGWADTGDGLYGERPKDEVLRIMRDSRLGAMGAISLFFLLIWKFAFFVTLARTDLWKIIIVMAVFSRWAQVLACGVSSYARTDGKGAYYIGRASRRDVFEGMAFVFLAAVILLGLKGVLAVVAAAGAVAVFIAYVNGRIGGMTGDTVGATSEVAEAVFLFAAGTICLSPWSI